MEMVEQKSNAELAALALKAYLEMLSEYEYCAGWLIGLEDLWWGRLKHGKACTDWHLPHLQVLGYLSDQAGGWWNWDTRGKECPVFLCTQEWEIEYQHRISTDASSGTGGSNEGEMDEE